MPPSLPSLSTGRTERAIRRPPLFGTSFSRGWLVSVGILSVTDSVRGTRPVKKRCAVGRALGFVISPANNDPQLRRRFLQQETQTDGRRKKRPAGRCRFGCHGVVEALGIVHLVQLVHSGFVG